MARDRKASAEPTNGRRRRRRRPYKTRFLRGVLLGGFLGSCITAAAFMSSDVSFYAQTPIKNLVASTDAEFPEGIYTFVDRLQKSASKTDSDLYAVPENSDQFDFWVRAASFKEKGLAESLRGSLMLLNLPVKTSSSEVDDRLWHLVSVGPFSREIEAKRVLTLLREEDLRPSLVKVAVH